MKHDKRTSQKISTNLVSGFGLDSVGFRSGFGRVSVRNRSPQFKLIAETESGRTSPSDSVRYTVPRYIYSDREESYSGYPDLRAPRIGAFGT